MDIEERVAEGQTLEPSDELTDEYRDLLTGMIQFTANSEFIGAFSERPWIEKAPSYHRKLALTAKIQDEIGHAQMQYRLAADLGEDRGEMFQALLDGESGFGNAFHYPVDEWLDIALIALFIDGAAMQLQHSLMDTSYGPYARVMQRICREEEVHFRHGEHIVREYATGTPAMQEALQEAIDRWWPRAMMFYGLSDEESPKTQRMVDLGIKPKTNDTLRQEFLDTMVPKVRDIGMKVPDEKVERDEESGRWNYTEPDWTEFKRIVTEGGPCAQQRLDDRAAAFEDTQWVRDALSAYNDRRSDRFSNEPARAGGD